MPTLPSPMSNTRVIKQTKSFLRRRFAEAGIRPVTRRGQNFLIDLNLQRLLVNSAELEPRDVVLEVGTGFGYHTEILVELVAKVYTVEIIKPLAERASAALASQGYKTVRCRHADGYHGWKEEAPFDAIIVTCAAGHLPPPLWQQLKPGGRIVIPIGGPYELQRLVVITKTADGKRRSKTIIPVRFVPLTRN